MDDSHDLSSSVTDVGALIFAGILFFAVTIWAMLYADNIAKNTAYRNFTDGIDRSIRAYSSCYKMTNDNLAKLAEGYLTKDDINPSVYNLESNDIEVDSVKAKDYFYKILSGNTGISKDILKSNKIYVVHIYTVYSYNPSTDSIKYKYYVQLFDSSGNPSYSTACNNLTAVEDYIEGCLKVDIDIARPVDSSIHKTLDYSRSNEFVVGNQTVSTFNTYMAIGVDIPLGARFSKELFNFCEIQTYATQR